MLLCVSCSDVLNTIATIAAAFAAIFSAYIAFRLCHPKTKIKVCKEGKILNYDPNTKCCDILIEISIASRANVSDTIENFEANYNGQTLRVMNKLDTDRGVIKKSPDDPRNQAIDELLVRAPFSVPAGFSFAGYILVLDFPLGNVSCEVFEPKLLTISYNRVGKRIKRRNVSIAAAFCSFLEEINDAIK